MKSRNVIDFAFTALLLSAILIVIPLNTVASDWTKENLDAPPEWALFNGPVVADLCYEYAGLEVLYWSDTEIYVYKSDGTRVYSGGFQAPTGYTFNTAPAVGDVDEAEDGYPEVIIGSTSSSYSHLEIYDCEGNRDTFIALNYDEIFVGITLADMDGDGYMEILAPRIMNKDYSSPPDYEYISCVNFIDELEAGLTICGTMSGGTLPWNQYTDCRHVSPCIGDFDRNGNLDVFMHDDEGLFAVEITSWPSTSAQTVGVDPFWNLDVSDFLGENEDGYFSDMGGALADIDGDDDLELLVTVDATVSGESVSRLYYVKFDDNIVTPEDAYISDPYSEADIEGILHNTPAIGDLDGNGDLQIAFGGVKYDSGEDEYQYRLLIAEYSAQYDFVNYDNSYWPHEFSAVSTMLTHHASFPAFADVNDDGQCDVLTSYEETGSGYTCAVEDDGTSIFDYSARDDNSRSAVWVGDLDFDGDMDVIYVSLEDDTNPDDAYLYFKDLAADWEPGYVEWSQFQNGPRHTGLYAQTWDEDISDDTWWEGRIIVTEDIVISPTEGDDATLTIMPGTVVEFESGTGITVNDYGALVCECWRDGSDNIISDVIVMKANNSSETWDGLTFDFNDQTPENNSSVINCIIQDVTTQAIKGIDIANDDDLEIEKVTIDAGSYGIYLQGVDGNISITDVDIDGATSSAVLLYDSDPILSDIDITSCARGLYMLAGSSPSYVEYCTFSGCNNNGIYASGASNGIFYNNSGNGGTNYIQNNSTGVYCTAASYPNFGCAAGYGNNVISGNHDGSKYEVDNSNSGASSVYAQYNYWGGGPQATWFNGSVIYSPYLEDAPEYLIPDPTKDDMADRGMDTDPEPPDIVERFYLAVNDQNWTLAASVLDSMMDEAETADEEIHVISLMGSLFRWSDQLTTGMTSVSSIDLTGNVDDFATLTCARLGSRAGNNQTALTLLNGLLAENRETNEDIAAWALLDKAFLVKYGLNNVASGNDLFEDFLDDYASHPESDIARIELGLAPINTSGKAICQVGGQPSEYKLHTAYPNPFNPVTTLSYSLPERAKVDLAVYNLQGQMVARLVDGWRSSGTHDVSFDASHLASGMYIYHITAGDFKASKKMILVK